VPGSFGHFFDGVLAVGFDGVHVDVTLEVVDRDQVGKFVFSGQVDFAEVLRHLSGRRSRLRLRENLGEIDLAAEHKLPDLITVNDLQGDVHMHTVETDGKNTIEKWPKLPRHTATATSPSPITPRTWLSQRPRRQARPHPHPTHPRSQRPPERHEDFAGIEVDILGDGDLDLSDDVLSQMDVVIASVHSQFNQDRAKMTSDC